jgi:hypothetical protein
VTLSLPDSKAEEIIRSSSSAGTASIDLSKAANATTALLPQAAVGAIAAADLALEVILPQGSVTLTPQAARSAVSQAAGANIALEVRTVSPASLNARQQAAVGGAPVYDISLTSGGEYIVSFQGGRITIALPYTLKPGEKPAGVVVWYLDGEGNVQKMNGMYDVRTQTMVFTTDHLSIYFITYDAKAAEAAEVWNNPFADVREGDWFYGDAAYVHKNGLFGGIAPGAFGPGLPMSRAMLATVLGRLAGIDASLYTGVAPFGDVDASQYYAPYVRWANAGGIVNGTGGGVFAPGAPVSRQDLAVILVNYARHTGRSLSARQAYAGFADGAAIAGYARAAVETVARAGIIGGKPSNLFDPEGSATRAEVAAILRRFVESAR